MEGYKIPEFRSLINQAGEENKPEQRHFTTWLQ
jgi:hypothetical protein